MRRREWGGEEEAADADEEAGVVVEVDEEGADEYDEDNRIQAAGT